MIRTGEQYRDSIRDDREVFINGERVKDVTARIRCSSRSSMSVPASTTCSTRRRRRRS